MELVVEKKVVNKKKSSCKQFEKTGKLCKPSGWFDTVEICKKCNKIL